MDKLFNLLDTVWRAITALDPIYQAVIAGIALFIPLSRYIWPGWRLLRHALYRGQPLAWLRALLELLRCLFHVGKTRSLFQAARLRIEVELFNPRPTAPLSCSAVADIPNELKKYRSNKREWRRKVSTLLIRLAEDAKQGMSEVRVQTCFDVHQARENLECYFAALAMVAPAYVRDTDRCLARVRIEQGFVAPLYLLTGLLATYDEDWSHVIDDYGRAITLEDDALGDRALRRLQTFLFDCWLLWGPSIPVCVCDNWDGVSALQYGYGDENNSIPLFGAGLVAELGKLIARVKDDAHAPVAFQASITGVPCWGPSIEARKFCIAQQALCQPESGMLLEFVAIEAIGSRAEEVKRRYYSAYIWVMFVICDAAGEPLFKEQRWRGLLPIYEHGNIADGKTYAVLKRQLARKALGLLRDLAAAHTQLRFRFVCAFDATLCGKMLPFAQSPPSLHDLLMETVAEQPGLAAGVLLDTPDSWKDSVYTACHLPQLLAQYNDYIKPKS